ncbi:putative oxidoreductase [Gordonia effusa NBRC 100432]|uniref:Putative oxidoreductase n=1 Tax=Gordonia effusa NBRC 100432 TaxID=1077974 RepID=H0QUU9_9ACTN|nr:NADP-dependent oxidoreductase [Gordonia effusa]GAB16600.1 putative oxidoreductase [Gordonia effusa NBRC 100432]
MAKTVVATAFGQPADVVEVLDIPTPSPGAGQVVVTSRASALNPIDVKTITGAMGTNPAKLPIAIGFEASGVVSAIGEGAVNSSGRPLNVGDEVVVYRANGGLSTDILADGADVHDKPADLPFDVAAGLLLVGVTAADTLATAAVTASDTVLIHGGAGAVGTIAVQLAIAKGANVIATASESNHEYLRGLGAVPVTYGEGLLERVRQAAPDGVTAAIDTVGTDEAIDVSLAVVSDPARIVSIAAFGRGDDAVLVNGSTPQSQRNRLGAIPGLLTDAAAGRLVLDVAKVFALDDAAAALTELAASHPRGKLILHP